uniref:Serine-threonine/tyrosine-protein kinase catalytic domain-containing protein n=1 Tax=Leersia perrieri TaxID=77586 RepID=A0A0D9WEE2_9ORYZ
MAQIMRRCWDANPKKRMEMDKVVRRLEVLDVQLKSPPAGGCFCLFKPDADAGGVVARTASESEKKD